MINPSDREVTVFNAARQLAAGAQAVFLAEACAGDAALRQRIEELLRASEEAGAFLQEPARGAQRPAEASAPSHPEETAAPAEKVGNRIGRYKLLQQIGEGGCGVVYMAEQEEPVRRRVALKIIKLGMDTKSVIARFEAERQALALMDHANIAKVLDAGATDTGRPYFVMELVRGVRITEYCDENKVSTEARLELFIRVCQAIQHAHQKGVIHRDIKPSNILVTVNDGVAVPKVIDFGIAKATQGRLTVRTLFTAFEQFIGTPAYMSPEQAVMTSLDVDTRSDIYSMGVLLYELLTGRTPFDSGELLASGLEEMRRTIRQQEPPRPSTRLRTLIEGELSTTAKRRQIEPLKLVHLVRGDLDWIAMKCLEKDRTRRYETVNGLALDVQRHLNDEPVLARPPSRFYEFQKTVRRHKFGFAAAATVITVLAVGVLASTWEALRATRAEENQTRLRIEAESARTNEALLRDRAQQGERQAREAQKHATDELWHSYLAQARAARFSGQSGRRFDSLEALKKATAIRFAPELRDEAIACLALPDFKLLHSVDAAQGAFDAALLHYAVVGTNLGDISIRRVSDNQEVMLLPNPPGTVYYSGRFSPDGRWLPVLCLDHRLRIWDLKRGVVALDLPCATRHQGLDFRPDSQCVAVAAGRARISIYRLGTGEEVNSFPTPFIPAHVRYDPSGKKLALSSWEDPRLSVIDADSGTEVMTMTNSEFLGEVAWHPRNSTIAVAGKQHLLFVWDSVTGELLQKLKGHQSGPDSVAFNHDGDILISSGWDGTHLWDVKSGEDVMRLNTPSDLNGFAPDDRTFGQFCWHPKGSLELLAFASGSEARRLQANGEDADNNHKAVAFSGDGTWLAFGAGGFVKLYDARTGDLLATLPTGPVAGVRFQRSGSGLLVSSEDGLFVWPIRTDGGTSELTIGPPKTEGPPGAWQQVSLSENGRVFAAFHGNQVWTFDAETMRAIAHTDLLGGQQIFGYISLSPDGLWLTTSGWHDTTVKVWNSLSGALVKELGDPEWIPDGSPNPAFEPSGRSLIIACGTHYRAWDTNSWTPGLRVARSDMNMLALSHRNRMVAMRNGQTSIQLLDQISGEVLATLQSPLHGFVLDFTFSPDDTQLAVTYTLTRDLLIWDLRLVREQLAQMGLDWNRPPFPPIDYVVSAKPAPWRVLTNSGSAGQPSPGAHGSAVNQ